VLLAKREILVEPVVSTGARSDSRRTAPTADQGAPVVRGEFFLDPHQPFVHSAADARSAPENDPTIPALHCAITRSGTEIMNSGAPITGIDRRPLNKAGMDIRKNLFVIHGQRDALI